MKLFLRVFIMKRILISLLSLSLLLGASCSNTEKGAGIGAGGGAILGGLIGGDVRGAAIGAGIGALGGAVIGSAQDNDERTKKQRDESCNDCNNADCLVDQWSRTLEKYNGRKNQLAKAKKEFVSWYGSNCPKLSETKAEALIGPIPDDIIKKLKK